jgi:hypothetical protein
MQCQFLRGLLVAMAFKQTIWQRLTNRKYTTFHSYPNIHNSEAKTRARRLFPFTFYSRMSEIFRYLSRFLFYDWMFVYLYTNFQICTFWTTSVFYVQTAAKFWRQQQNRNFPYRGTILNFVLSLLTSLLMSVFMRNWSSNICVTLFKADLFQHEPFSFTWSKGLK